MANEGLAIPSLFFLQLLNPKRYPEGSGILFVLTNRRRTRTLVRFREEAAFVRHKKGRDSARRADQGRPGAWKDDYFHRM